MKTILVPVDYTPVSVNAAYYAADMACSMKYALCLLHVYPLPVTGDDVIPIYGPDETETFEKERIEKLKSSLLERTNKKIQITAKLIQDEIFPAIRYMCAVIKPYAVVMGRETATRLSRLLKMAPTFEALQKLNCPLVIVPETATFSSIKNIGLASDFKKVQDTTPFDQVKNIIQHFNAALHILHISETRGEIFDPAAGESIQQLQEMLHECKPKYHNTTADNIEEALKKLAQENHLDMLIVILKESTVLQHLFRKRISKQLVLHLQLPLIALRMAK